MPKKLATIALKKPTVVGTKLNSPCPHPARNGKHEEYLIDGKLVCRACGAS